jgi:hypothetical protein
MSKFIDIFLVPQEEMDRCAQAMRDYHALWKSDGYSYRTPTEHIAEFDKCLDIIGETCSKLAVGKSVFGFISKLLKLGNLDRAITLWQHTDRRRKLFSMVQTLTESEEPEPEKSSYPEHAADYVNPGADKPVIWRGSVTDFLTDMYEVIPTHKMRELEAEFITLLAHGKKYSTKLITVEELKGVDWDAVRAHVAKLKETEDEETPGSSGDVEPDTA